MMVATQKMIGGSRSHRLARAALTLFCGALVMAACTHMDDRTKFNGRYYPAKGRSVDGNRANFVVTVKRINQGLDGARKAALQEAHHYCIKNFGTSDIIWQARYDREVTQADVQNGQFLVSGKCVEW